MEYITNVDITLNSDYIVGGNAGISKFGRICILNFSEVQLKNRMQNIAIANFSSIAEAIYPMDGTCWSVSVGLSTRIWVIDTTLWLCYPMEQSFIDAPLKPASSNLISERLFGQVVYFSKS